MEGEKEMITCFSTAIIFLIPSLKKKVWTFTPLQSIQKRFTTRLVIWCISDPQLHFFMICLTFYKNKVLPQKKEKKTTINFSFLKMHVFIAWQDVMEDKNLNNIPVLAWRISLLIKIYYVILIDYFCVLWLK